MVVLGKANDSRLSQLVGVPAAAGGAKASQTAGMAQKMRRSRARKRAVVAVRQCRVMLGFTSASLNSGILGCCGHDLPVRPHICARVGNGILVLLNLPSQRIAAGGRPRA